MCPTRINQQCVYAGNVPVRLQMSLSSVQPQLHREQQCFAFARNSLTNLSETCLTTVVYLCSDSFLCFNTTLKLVFKDALSIHAVTAKIKAKPSDGVQNCLRAQNHVSKVCAH